MGGKLMNDYRIVEKMKKKLKHFCLGVLYLIIGPVYAPALILWQERDKIKEYYLQCFKAITFKDLD